MRHGNAVAIFILVILTLGCAESRRVQVTYLSNPTGGSLYGQNDELLGPCPRVMWYDADAEAMEKGYLNVERLTVRWPTGPEKMSDDLIRITVNNTARRVMFVQPKDEPKVPSDAASSQENTPSDIKLVEPKDIVEVTVADTELPTEALAPIDKKPPVETEPIEKPLVPIFREPAVVEKPSESPEKPLESLVGPVLTLSEQQLVLLDWNRANHGGARVQGKRPVGGLGVEFGIYFPSNSHGSCSLSFVSTGAGGRGSLVGTDVSGYKTFALKLILVSINGQSDPDSEQKLVAGAVIGPTAEGRLTGYEPITLSLADSENTVTAITAMSTDEVYEIGFHIHALNHEEWSPSGSKIVLRAEPVEVGKASPFKSSR